jgi:hypothetical protein
MSDLRTKLPNSRDVAKVLIALSMGALTEACGVAKNQGHFVAGTTSFLAEYQRGQLANPDLDQTTERDRQELTNLIRRTNR